MKLTVSTKLIESCKANGKNTNYSGRLENQD